MAMADDRHATLTEHAPHLATSSYPDANPDRDHPRVGLPITGDPVRHEPKSPGRGQRAEGKEGGRCWRSRWQGRREDRRSTGRTRGVRRESPRELSVARWFPFPTLSAVHVCEGRPTHLVGHAKVSLCVYDALELISLGGARVAPMCRQFDGSYVGFILLPRAGRRDESWITT